MNCHWKLHRHLTLYLTLRFRSNFQHPSCSFSCCHRWRPTLILTICGGIVLTYWRLIFECIAWSWRGITPREQQTPRPTNRRITTETLILWQEGRFLSSHVEQINTSANWWLRTALGGPAVCLEKVRPYRAGFVAFQKKKKQTKDLLKQQKVLGWKQTRRLDYSAKDITIKRQQRKFSWNEGKHRNFDALLFGGDMRLVWVEKFIVKSVFWCFRPNSEIL